MSHSPAPGSDEHLRRTVKFMDTKSSPEVRNALESHLEKSPDFQRLRAARTDICSLPEGQVMLSYPATLKPASVLEMIEFLELVKRKLTREDGNAPKPTAPALRDVPEGGGKR